MHKDYERQVKSQIYNFLQDELGNFINSQGFDNVPKSSHEKLLLINWKLSIKKPKINTQTLINGLFPKIFLLYQNQNLICGLKNSLKNY